MTLAFILTMPNRGSWDGKWSGQDNLYAITKRFTTKKAIQKYLPLIGKNFYYSWSDGWGANIQCKELTPSESRMINKKSKGFCGYEWMVDEILTYGNIRSEK